VCVCVNKRAAGGNNKREVEHRSADYRQANMLAADNVVVNLFDLFGL
jgi:hypothetical protein